MMQQLAAGMIAERQIERDAVERGSRVSFAASS